MLLSLQLLQKLFVTPAKKKKNKKRKKRKSDRFLQSFVLEPILTPSALVDNPNDPNDDIDIDRDDGDAIADDGSDDTAAPNNAPPAPVSGDEYEVSPWVTADNAEYPGTFIVGETGEVGVDFLFDGGAYQGEIAIFSLEGMEDLEVGSEEFTRLAAERALSNSSLGHVVIQDLNEGAKFSHAGWEPDFNTGDYQGVKTVTMNPGDRFAIMLMPDHSVQAFYDDPDVVGNKVPLFSLDSANPDNDAYLTRMTDVTGDGNTFAMEDWRLDANSDRDYNDVVFQIRGAKGDAPLMDAMVNPARDWRDEDFGQALVTYARSYVDGTDYEALDPDFAASDQPLVGVIDTGFSGDNPDLDYSRIITGSDFVDGDRDPFLAAGEGNEHGDLVLGTLGQVNDDAPIWVSRAINSGRWAESLIEFVDAARESGQPNAIVNLSMDLTQIDAEGNVSTRYEFTPLEMAALEYARQNDILVAVASGNEGGLMSALGRASEQFDNIITVGSADLVDADAPVWEGFDRADYSSYGYGLDIVAEGTLDDTEGTSLATARVTGAASQIWAANPELSYRQVKEILQETAIDLNAPGWDAETGAGLVNIAAAISLAKATQSEEYKPDLQFVPMTWGGEGEVTPMERAANLSQSTTVYTATQQSAWTNFRNMFGNYQSTWWQNFLKRIFEKYYNIVRQPRTSQVTLGHKVDFNGDGQSDFLRQEKGGWDNDQNYTANVFFSNGNGTFNLVTLPENFYLNGDKGSILHMGDFNGDGKTDFLRQEKGGWDNDLNYTANVFFSNGDGSFNRVTLPESFYLSGDNGANLHIGDFNGDGKTDFLRQEKGDWDNDRNYTANVFFSNGNGSFNRVTLPEYFDLSGDNGVNLHMGDFNGDGKTDFLRQEKGGWDNDRFNTANVFFSNGNGSFNRVTLPESFDLSGDNGVDLHMGDFNGDGKTDFLRQEKGGWDNDSFNTANVFLSNGNGTFRKINLPQDFALTGDLTDLHMGDFNGDGKTDFLRQEHGVWDNDTVNTAHLFFSNGNGTFNRVNLPENFDLKGDLTHLHMSDFNGDGKTDFLRQEKGDWDNDAFNTANAFLSLGNGTFSKVTLPENFHLSSDNGANLYTNNVRPWEDDNVILKPGSHSLTFHRGQEWVAPTGYKFAFQHDGNLVLYTPEGKAIWATGTHGTGANSFAVQADGNVVLYDHGKAVWATDTAGHPGAYFAIQGDGNLVVYSQDGQPLFNTGTNGGKVRQLNTASRDWLNKHQPSTKPGYVNGNVGSYPLNFRSSPQVSASNKIGTLPQGTSLTILEKVTGGTYSGRNDWYKVKVGSQIGYVAAYYVSEGSNNSGSNGTWQHPLPGYPVTSEYGPRWGKFHYGIDIGAPTGTPIKAAKPGQVVEVGYHPNGWGNFVRINHDGFQTVSAHLSSVNVSVGQSIGAGTIIGGVGSTGYSTGPHLHFEVRVAPYRWKTDNRNPRNYINF